jgi:hypothetical protein
VNGQVELIIGRNFLTTTINFWRLHSGDRQLCRWWHLHGSIGVGTNLSDNIIADAALSNFTVVFKVMKCVSTATATTFALNCSVSSRCAEGKIVRLVSDITLPPNAAVP